MQSKTSVGLTRDTGWQVGLRRTIAAPVEEVWSKVFSTPGLTRWLGAGDFRDLTPGSHFKLKDGTECEVRVLKHHSHIRISWKPVGWSRPSLIQIRCLEAKSGTTVAFHQEHLPDADQRALRHAVFNNTVNWLVTAEG